MSKMNLNEMTKADLIKLVTELQKNIVEKPKKVNKPKVINEFKKMNKSNQKIEKDKQIY